MKNLTSEQKEIILKGLYARKEQLTSEAYSHKNAGIAYTLAPNYYREICDLITIFESWK